MDQERPPRELTQERLDEIRQGLIKQTCDFINLVKVDPHVLMTMQFDIIVATHYDADHIGGLDEILENGWAPEIAALDRGDSNLRPFLRERLENCVDDLDAAEKLAEWGTAKFCPLPDRAVMCSIIDYFAAAKGTGKRKTLEAGEVLELDHGLKLTALVANAKDIDGGEVEVYFDGRRDDCGENDFSIGILVEFGDFRYVVTGDLTGNKDERVAAVESLIVDDVQEVDVYKVGHHGSNTSSTGDFVKALMPTVAVVSNGSLHCHPSVDAINRLLALDPRPQIYLTNQNPEACAFHGDADGVANADFQKFDGTIEFHVWKRSYRVWRWRNGSRIDDPGRKFFIKRRD